MLEKKKHRILQGEFVAEGPKVVGDLLFTMRPKCIYATDSWISSHSDLQFDKCVEVTEIELKRISFLQHPQDVLATFPLPDTTENLEESVSKIKKNICLALDGVQDPGNLGTIIRVADWFGVDTIYCSYDTADAYNPKVVQATMGSISRVKMIYTDLVSLTDSMSADIGLYGTFLDGENLWDSHLGNSGLIIMGNEGNGISPLLASRLRNKLLIPPYPPGQNTAESLNVAVATALCLAEFRRRQR